MQNRNNRYVNILILYLMTLGGLTIATAQTTDLANLINEQTQGLPEGTELSIGMLEDGKYTKLGYRVEGQKLVAFQNENKIFEIGSITKIFTASLIMNFVEEGKIYLADPMQKFLPVQMAQDSFVGNTILIQHLLMHTSGLSNGPSSFTMPYLGAKIFSPKNPNRNFKAKHYFRYLKKFNLDYMPGQAWEYNNAAYGLLGVFIKDLNGSSWEEAVQEHIFGPLAMQHSYFEINKSNKDQFITGITAKGKKSKPWEMKFINSAGAIKSTLNDMLIFAAAQLNPPADSLRFLQAVHDPLSYEVKMPADKLWKGNAMGIGWWHNIEDAQNSFIWHAGSTGGYTAFIGFSTEKNRAVVILSNISSSHPSARAANRIPKPIFLGQKMMRMN